MQASPTGQKGCNTAPPPTSRALTPSTPPPSRGCTPSPHAHPISAVTRLSRQYVSAVSGIVTARAQCLTHLCQQSLQQDFRFQWQGHPPLKLQPPNPSPPSTTHTHVFNTHTTIITPTTQKPHLCQQSLQQHLRFEWQGHQAGRQLTAGPVLTNHLTHPLSGTGRLQTRHLRKGGRRVGRRESRYGNKQAGGKQGAASQCADTPAGWPCKMKHMLACASAAKPLVADKATFPCVRQYGAARSVDRPAPSPVPFCPSTSASASPLTPAH